MMNDDTRALHKCRGGSVHAKEAIVSALAISSRIQPDSKITAQDHNSK